MNEWRVQVKKESHEAALCRFFIAFDELRARLAPLKYPNIEISDEGYLWFNINTSKGTIEVLAFPHGFKELEQPLMAVSLPSQSKDVDSKFFNKLQRIASNIAGGRVFACFCKDEETLNAYKQNKHPPLACAWNPNEIFEMKKKTSFLII